MTKLLLCPLRQWLGAPILCGELQHNSSQDIVCSKSGVAFFFFNTTLWGNLKAQDLKGI